MSFAAPAFLWLLLGVPAVIVLHFVRTRRQRVTVSALFLWTQARELAQRRRRFSRSWLLALQIAAVVAGALALARPALQLGAAPDRVLVIDASASMAARAPDGATRLERAAQEAREQLGGGGRVALVRAGLDATVVHPLDGDRAGLRAAVAGLAAGDREADLERALALAASVAPGGEIHLFGDRPPPEGGEAEVRYHPVGDDLDNVGIASFDVGLQQAFVAIASNLARPTEITVTLAQGERTVASSTLLLPVGRNATATFPVAEGGLYSARIEPPPGDALALDDVAWAGRGTLRVALERPSVPLERALGAVPGTALRLGGAAASADAHVLFGEDPATLPPGRWLVFAEPAADARTVTVRDWDQSDPLLRFVDLRGVAVAISPEWQAPEGEGWRTLASAADLTPLLLRRRDAARDVVVAAFHPSQTDMVFRPAFPAFIANVLAAFGTRDPLPLGTPLPTDSVRLEGAGGSVDGGGGRPLEAGTRALEPGVYRVAGQLRPVSLLSAAETRLGAAPAPAPAGAGGARLELAPDLEPTRGRDLAPWLLVALLLALLGEWLLFNRRSGGLRTPFGRARRGR